MMKRNVNVDFFRITATILVIILHVLGQGGVLRTAPQASAVYWGAWFLEICAYCAVNGFALISGFVMVDKSIKLKSIIAVWMQVIFYSILLTVLSFVLFPESRSFNNAINSLFPILGKQWWYISSYFALFFFIPFLNKAIHSISQQTYKKFLLLVLVGIGLLGCIIPRDGFSLEGGYSFVWLMILYLFGAYIKKYEVHKKITALKSIIGFFAMVILTLASKLAIQLLAKKFPSQQNFENTFVSYVSITIILSAVFLFLFCLNIKINGFGSKIICFLSPVTLGVYLIHVHPFIFNYYMNNAFSFLAHKPMIVMSLCVLGIAFSIFVLCAIIELLRIQLFKLIRVGKFCDFLSRKIESLYSKVFEK